ncbi:cupin-like domain-containing protein [Sphingomonas mesophila]|uniref:cupin-like domain-containing protein n=1 Tax=Sphingomonas mesophila TaxID=2303576 RepID=UPI000E57A031|nr:cupin-like domain-containing protein [Sphingomonas mesophila]
MDLAPIDRLSCAADREAIAARIASAEPRPFIVTDGTARWPARTKWTLEFFADRYGDSPGIAPLEFGVRPPSGKATLLKAFIRHLDDAYTNLPGLWVGPKPEPADPPQSGWSFSWEPFKHDPALLDDVAPFPEAVPNLTACLPRDLFHALEAIHRHASFSIYISPRDTITPLHRDRHNLFACLVQFQGRKQVVLFAPGDGTSDGALAGFDPESPDDRLFPTMRGRAALGGRLEPQDMLIIPPNWLHYTRSENHSLTLSHNFFNAANLGDYLRSLLAEIGR